MRAKILNETTNGYVKCIIYSCPCSKGIIEEENDYIPGHSDSIIFLHCPNYEKIFYRLC